MFRSKIPGMFRLFRFELPFTAGVCVILGELLGLGAAPTLKEILAGFLSVFFISAAALILNDYFDVESDRINAPHRPLPSGAVTTHEVVLLSCFVTAMGFISAVLISFNALLVVILVWAVGFLYNWRYKRTGLLGNLMVSFSVGMTFIFGGLVVGRTFDKTTWLFGMIALLIDLGEEIAADAMDVAGDRQAGSRSLAVLLGSEGALKISAGIFVCVILTSALPFLLGWLGWVYLLPILLMDMVIVFSTLKLLDARVVHRRSYIRWIYLGGLFAIIIFIALKMFGR